MLSLLRIFLNNVPHIPAEIFSLVDYGSFKICPSSAFESGRGLIHFVAFAILI